MNELSNDVLSEICLSLTGTYTKDMIHNVSIVDLTVDKSEGLFSDADVCIRYMVVIIDCAEVIKVLYDHITDTVEEVKRFNICTW